MTNNGGEPSETDTLDYAALGFRAGLEIHQQLSGTKLFCACPAAIREDEPHFTVLRQLRASVGESGEVDVAAAHEQRKEKWFAYQGYQDTTCLVELDEEPVSRPAPRAVETAVMVARLLKTHLLDEVHVMRKVVVDGSNTSAFQRTMLVARDGQVADGAVRIDQLCLEEDAAKIVSRGQDKDVYNLSRLGIPLLEITTEPDITSPEQLRDVAAEIGMILRSTGRVLRGLGTIRQDVNISIADGSRVEIKGVQALDLIPQIAGNEVRRQLGLVELSRESIPFAPDDVQSVVVSEEMRTDTGWIRKALESGEAVGAKLSGLGGLLGRELFEGYRLGTELSGFAKAWGFGGIIHDAESPEKYGLKDWSGVRKALSAQHNDGFFLVLGDEKRGRALISRDLPQRLQTLLAGVPSEVRKANEDGTTSYLRPMPGASRMYPETDVRPFSVQGVEVELPELLSERSSRMRERYGLSESDADQLLRVGRADLFEEWQERLDRSVLLDVLLVKEKELRRRHGVAVDVDALAGPLLERLATGDVPKDAVEAIMREFAEKGSVGWDRYAPIDEEEIRKVVREVLAKDPDAPFGASMGQAMARLQGKADGKIVSRILKEERE